MVFRHREYSVLSNNLDFKRFSISAVRGNKNPAGGSEDQKNLSMVPKNGGEGGGWRGIYGLQMPKYFSGYKSCNFYFPPP